MRGFSCILGSVAIDISSVPEEAMLLLFFFSLSLSLCVGFWASAETYTVIIYTQREQLPLLRKKHLDLSFTPSFLFFFYHAGTLASSQTVSLQFFVSVFYSFSFVFFFLSVIHLLCPLPSPYMNIKNNYAWMFLASVIHTVKAVWNVIYMVKFDISKATP